MIDSLLYTLLAALAGAAFLWAAVRHWRESGERRRQRAGILDEVQRLFDGGLRALQPDGFPRISGTYGGHTFDIQVLADSLNMRKLPALWLLVSLPEPVPVRGTFDLMMRPRGIEPFSKFASLPVQVAPHPELPHDCAVRTDAPQALPSPDLIVRHIRIFDDPRAKELVISPKGLRIVWLLEEAHRGKYLLFRDGEMGRLPVRDSDVRPLLDYLMALQADIIKSNAETAA